MRSNRKSKINVHIHSMILSRLVYQEKVVSSLVKRADVNATTPDGSVPLDLTESSTTIRLLLMHGATPNYQQAEKCLPHDLLKDQMGMAIKIFVLGNPGVGKSTLLKAISVEAKGFLDRIIKYFFQVAGIDRNTAGIIPHDIHSRMFGNATLFDCAGHKEYYAGHGAVLSNSMSGFPSIILLVVDMRDVKETFRETLQYWLEFINIHSDEASTPHLVIVGSHADQCKDREEKIRLVGSVTRSINLGGFVLKGCITIDCRYAESTPMTKLRALLFDSCQSLRISEQMSLTDHCFLVFVLDKFKEYPAVTIGMVEDKFGEVCDEEVHWSFMKFHNLLEICERLNKRGNILFMKSPELPRNSWIVINKAAILSLVNGVMFAPKNFKQYVDIGSSTGVVSQSSLVSLFPSVDSNLITKFLCHLEFCQEITDHDILSSLQAESISQPQCHDRFFLFPDLVNCDAPTDALQPQADFQYHTGWILQCMRTDRYFTSRFSQVLLLRLAFKFAFVKPLMPFTSELRVNCKIWKNGVSWFDRSGARAIVEIVDQNHVVVLAHSIQRVALVQLRSSIIREVLKAKEEHCRKVLVNELLVLPEDARVYPIDLTQITAVSLTEIAQAIIEDKPYAVFNADTLVSLKRLLHFEPYADLGKELIQELFSDDSERCFEEIEDRFLQQIASKACNQLDDFTVILKPLRLQLDSLDRHATPAQQLLRIFQLWMEDHKETAERSKWTLGNLLDSFSVFAGRNPLAVATSMYVFYVC